MTHVETCNVHVKNANEYITNDLFPFAAYELGTHIVVNTKDWRTEKQIKKDKYRSYTGLSKYYCPFRGTSRCISLNLDFYGVSDRRNHFEPLLVPPRFWTRMNGVSVDCNPAWLRERLPKVSPLPSNLQILIGAACNWLASLPFGCCSQIIKSGAVDNEDPRKWHDDVRFALSSVLSQQLVFFLDTKAQELKVYNAAVNPDETPLYFEIQNDTVNMHGKLSANEPRTFPQIVASADTLTLLSLDNTTDSRFIKALTLGFAMRTIYVKDTTNIPRLDVTLQRDDENVEDGDALLCCFLAAFGLCDYDLKRTLEVNRTFAAAWQALLDLPDLPQLIIDG